MTDEQRDKVYIFNTDFYSIYATDSNFPCYAENELDCEKRYKRVKEFLPASVNIFEKDFLVIPCLDNNHWFLIIVCYPNNIISLVENISTHHDKEFESKRKAMILCFDSVTGLIRAQSRREKAISHICNFIRLECRSKKYYNQPRFAEDILTCHVKVDFLPFILARILKQI